MSQDKLVAMRASILELADSLEPHTEYDTIKKLIAIAGSVPTSLDPALVADTIAEAFKAGMLAGFLTSCEGWNGEYLDIRDGTRRNDAIAEHINDEFGEFFSAYLSGNAMPDPHH